MSIETLGESLLSQAKSKRKKQEKRAKLFTGVMLGVQLGNSVLRKKAAERANEFWSSNQGLINERANQFTEGVKFWNNHNTMVNKYGEYKDKKTGENWTSAFKSDKLKQYQVDPEYKHLYEGTDKDKEEFNRIVNEKINNDINAYRTRVTGYSDFKNIKRDDKETRAAYQKPLRNKLQKGVDIINQQDSVGGWLMGKVGLRPSTELETYEVGGKKVVLPKGMGDVTLNEEGKEVRTKERLSLRTVLQRTVDNQNTIDSYLGVVGTKEPFTEEEIDNLVTTKTEFKPSIEIDKSVSELNAVASGAVESKNENLKRSDFIIKLGEQEITVESFLNEFEISEGVGLNDGDTQQIYKDAMVLTNLKLKIKEKEAKESGGGSLMMSNVNTKELYIESLQEVIKSDLKYKVVNTAKVYGVANEARGTYTRTLVPNRIEELKETKELPNISDEDLDNTNVEILKFTSPEQVMDDFNKNYASNVNWQNMSNEEKHKFITGKINEYPEMKVDLTSSFAEWVRENINNDKGSEGSEGSEGGESGVETGVPESLLTPKEKKEYAQGPLGVFQRVDEQNKGGAKEFNEFVKKIPSKIRLRTLNNVKEKANKFIEGDTSGFYSSEFTKWKKQNDITTTYRTPKVEYKKYVEEFLEDLEIQINSL